MSTRSNAFLFPDSGTLTYALELLHLYARVLRAGQCLKGSLSLRVHTSHDSWNGAQSWQDRVPPQLLDDFPYTVSRSDRFCDKSNYPDYP